MGMRRKDYLQSLVEAAIAVSHAEFKAGSMCEYEQAAQLRDMDKTITNLIIVECNKQKKWARKYEDLSEWSRSCALGRKERRMDDLAERIWEVSNKFDPYGFPPNDKEDDLKTIELTLDNEPMALIDGLVDMLENLED